MILLTGATGFLGSRILERLLDDDQDVVAIKRTSSNLERVNHLTNRHGLHFIDIDCVDASEIFTEFNVETIIHTATQYGRGNTAIVPILEANLILPIKLAEVGLSHGLQCFINTDSYFNKEHFSYTNLLNYSLSKKSLLIWLKELSKNLKVANVLLEHVYGPLDSGTKFVEHIIQDIAINKLERVPLSHGHQKRDFVYIEDVVDAYFKILDYSCSNEFTYQTFEVGTGESAQVRDFATTIKELSDSPSELGFGEIPYRGDEIMDSKADLTAMKSLGWSPRIPMREGVAKILNAYGVSAAKA